MLWGRSPTDPITHEAFWHWFAIAVINIVTITLLHVIAVILLTFWAHAVVKPVVWTWRQWP